VAEVEVQSHVAACVDQLLDRVEDRVQDGLHFGLGQLAGGGDGGIVALHRVEALLLDGVLALRLDGLLLARLAQQPLAELHAHDEAGPDRVGGLVELLEGVPVGGAVVLQRLGVLGRDVEGESPELAHIDVSLVEQILVDEGAERAPNVEDGFVVFALESLVLTDFLFLLDHLDHVVNVECPVGLRNPRCFYFYCFE